MSESHPATGRCQYCGESYIRDDDSPLGDQRTHEAQCVILKEWKRCKE